MCQSTVTQFDTKCKDGQGEIGADPSMILGSPWGAGGVISENQALVKGQEAPGPWVIAAGTLDSNHALLHTSLAL